MSRDPGVCRVKMLNGIVLLVLLVGVGCAKQKYGQCAAPNDHLEVMFKPKVTGHPFSHAFCIVCNTALESADYAAWAMEMGAPEGPANPESVHPCLYAYSGTPGTHGPDTLEGCMALVCEGGATYNDMVGKGNGNLNLEPLLNGETLVTSESMLEAAPEMTRHQLEPRSALR